MLMLAYSFSKILSFGQFSCLVLIFHQQHSSLSERPRPFHRHQMSHLCLAPRILKQFLLVGFERSVKFIGQDQFEE